MIVRVAHSSNPHFLDASVTFSPEVYERRSSWLHQPMALERERRDGGREAPRILVPLHLLRNNSSLPLYHSPHRLPRARKKATAAAVPNAGSVAVGSTITLGAAPTGYQSFLAAFGAGASAFFMLSDGAGRTLGGVWTVNSSTPATATITEILFNLRLGGTAGETFSSTCTAWNTLPAGEALVPRQGGTITGPLTLSTAPTAAPPVVRPVVPRVVASSKVQGGASTAELKRALQQIERRAQACVTALPALAVGQAAQVDFGVDGDGFFTAPVVTGEVALARCLSGAVKGVSRLERRPDTGEVRVRYELRLEAP
jgi:hypothetical protein